MATSRIHFEATVDLPFPLDAQPSSRPFAVLAAFPLALLVTAASLGGILLPGTYARETANWATQGIAQDWTDLLLAVPWLLVTGTLALRGSRRALLLLGGGYLFTAYTFAIYTFAVHFNGLFLLYCAVLGLSAFALAGLTAQLAGQHAARWYAEPIAARTAGIFLVIVGALFACLWLSEIVPAIARGTLPRSVAEAGAMTNPVHVLDLSVVLPLHVLVGVWLLRRRPAGRMVAPAVLGFGALMAASIAGLMLMMRQRGFDWNPIVFAAMVLMSLASGGAVALLLRRVRPR